MWFDSKIGHGTSATCQIPCDCVECTSMLDKPWVHGFPPQQQPRYQPIIDCTYRPVLGLFNNWNIIILSHKSTNGEAPEDIYQFVIDGISDNMTPLVQSVNYGVMNTNNSTKWATMLLNFSQRPKLFGKTLYVMEKLVQLLNFLSKLSIWAVFNKRKSVIGIKIISNKSSLFEHTIFYIHVLMLIVKYVHGIPKSFCNRNQVKQALQVHPIGLTDSDHNYIIEEIGGRYKI